MRGTHILGAFAALTVLGAVAQAAGPGGERSPVPSETGGLGDATPATAGSTAGSRRQLVGRSVRGRAIRVHRIGDRGARFKALVVGSIHGDEIQGHRVIGQLRGGHPGGVKGVDLWTIGTVNPDGVAARTRGNARGVDLNRNFDHRFDPSLSGGYYPGPRPFSEPESRVVAAISRRARFDLAIWYHQPWGRTLVPCNSSARAARRYARYSRLAARRGCGDERPGSAVGWQNHRFGTAAFVVELPGRKLRRSEAKRHAAAIVKLARRMR